MEDTAVQVTVDDLFDIGPEKTVFLCELIVIDLFEIFKIVLYTLVVLGFLWLSGLVDRGSVGHLPSPGKKL
ncbi:MAG: hypothetical protein SV775_17385 [Thermodesulfobacteriota bacterium]|nr:hypothetical protein [Thermodesulfobacteriota bacterium]